MKYYDCWKDLTDVLGCYKDSQLTDDEIVYAGYTYESYDGSAIVVFVRDGQWFENHDGHCSCYGLETWEPETTTPEAILLRETTGWPGLLDAVRARMGATC